MENLGNYSIPQLRALLTEAKTDTAASIVRCAQILSEMNKRGEFDPAMKSGALRWYREIAAEKITGMFAMTFPLALYMDRFNGVAADVQNALANGSTLVVAEKNAKGEIVRTEKTLLEMGQPTLDRVIDRKKVVSFEAQEKSLRRFDPAPVIEYQRIRVDLANEQLVFGNMKVDIAELRGPLAALGFRMSRIPEKEKVGA